MTVLGDLLDHVQGPVSLPGDDRYDEARKAWNLAFTHLPEVVVEGATVSDVVTAVNHARRAGLSVAIQATGHGVAMPAHGALLLVISGLDHVRIDPGRATATIGGGVKWAPVLEAAQQHGLAPLLGSSPDVGAVGYTLGGGFGWLGRKYGLSAQNVRSTTVVTASGEVVSASEDSNQDLFWALLGGGAGGLGVVVEMEIDLFPVTTVYAGNLLYPYDMARDVFDFYVDWSADLPVEVTSAFNITRFPPLDIVPEPLRGQIFAIVRGCHCGDMDDAAALIDRWRHWREPLMDMFGPMPFAEMAAISQDPVDPIPAIVSGRWLNGLDAGVFDAMSGVLDESEQPSPVLFAEARHAGGAISEGGAPAERTIEVVGLLPDDGAHHEARTRIDRMWASLESSIPTQGAYLNFNEGEERRALTRSAFDDAGWDNLVGVKKRFDPDNLFSHGLDIPVM